MQNKVAVLSLLTEMRGRLDELERLVRFSPDQTAFTPLSYETHEVLDITPPGYQTFRKTGIQGTQVLHRVTPMEGFVQFGAPDADTQCEVTSFALSDLHRNDATPGFGLSMIALGDRQDWFAFEFLAPDLDPKDWHWTEWVLKIATQAPGTLFSQFILYGEGEPVFVVIGAHEVSEFATFYHFKLDREMIPADRLASMQQVRLVLSTGGLMMALNLYAYGVYGTR